MISRYSSSDQEDSILESNAESCVPMLPLQSEVGGSESFSESPPPALQAYQPFRYGVKAWNDQHGGVLGLVIYIVVLAGLGLAFILPGASSFWYLITIMPVVLSLVFLVLTNQSDPGLIPPKPHKDPTITAVEAGQIDPADAGIWKGLGQQWCRQPEDAPEDAEPERYCTSCNIWRPERASHCTLCSFCFERFDHHCGVLGTCIARDNHRFFVAFLMCASTAAITMSVAGIYRFTGRFGEDVKPGPKDWQFYVGGAVLICVVYTSVLGCFACSHCAMLLCNVTSKQMATSDRRPRGARPPRPSCSLVRAHVRGMLRNITVVFCGRVRWKYAASRPFNHENYLLEKV
mmetsp:Transcript_28274/g.61952  ORF Transcript_28274/g.61952 Transcript_28274/m.61952 type:complete len:346 (-) Transcript_28274:61-1098(-)